MSKQIIIDITEELINMFRVFLDHNQLQVEDENIDLLAQQITDVIKEKMPKPALPSKQNGDKPKRPLNAYILWSRKKRPEIKKQIEADDDIEKKDKGREVMRRLAAAWQEAKSDDEDEDVKAAKEEAYEQKEAYEALKDVPAREKVKRGPNSYHVWSKAHRKDVIAQMTEENGGDKPEPFAVTREVARQWKNYKETDEGKDFIEKYKSGSDNEDEKRPVAKPLKSRVASKESKQKSEPKEHNSDSDNESVPKEQKPTLSKFRVATKKPDNYAELTNKDTQMKQPVPQNLMERIAACKKNIEKSKS